MSQKADKLKALETAIGQIERQFGKGSIMKLGSRQVITIERLFHHPQGRGGGMFNEGGSPTVTNCIFMANSASIGGGIGSATSIAKCGGTCSQC